MLGKQQHHGPSTGESLLKGPGFPTFPQEKGPGSLEYVISVSQLCRLAQGETANGAAGVPRAWGVPSITDRLSVMERIKASPTERLDKHSTATPSSLHLMVPGLCYLPCSHSDWSRNMQWAHDPKMPFPKAHDLYQWKLHAQPKRQRILSYPSFWKTYLIWCCSQPPAMPKVLV